MQKKGYFINNSSSDNINLIELNVILPPGISNLFELNDNLTYEQIDYSLKNGTLRGAIENKLCYPVPNPIDIYNFPSDVLIRKPIHVQALPSRARFVTVKNPDHTVFDNVDDADLFPEVSVKSARELAEELQRSTENVEKIEATIKQANLPEKPLENRYIPPSVRAVPQDKLKNDIKMNYVTCEGFTAEGKRCMRRAKTGKKYCGLHRKQRK